MRKEGTRTLLAALAAFASAAALAAPSELDTIDARSKVDSFAAELAAELSMICPPAKPGDQAAFERCRQGLFNESFLKRNLSPVTLWGRANRDPKKGIKDTTLTQFGGDVLTGMYIPLFMFNGKYTISYEEREKMYLVGMEVGFRNRLAPGEFPYPFWHDANKWSTYQGANLVKFWVDPKQIKIRVAQFTDLGSASSMTGSKPVPHEFEGKWMWTDAQGQEQPAVTLFDGLFSRENPNLGKLDSTYRALALKLREGQCMNCHTPDNPNEMRRIVLLQTPAHAAGEVKRLMKAVREDRMPRDETGIEDPLDAKLKNALLEKAGAFEQAYESAKEWERGNLAQGASQHLGSLSSAGASR
jgi:hypothetical protein